jgi:CubicO group peptidase (beta-lactamase class C family)
MIHGSVAQGFEAMRDKFGRKFAERGGAGGACAICRKGEKGVDIWSGYGNVQSREPWKENTMALVFSTTKGKASMTATVAHSRGLSDCDEKAAEYWPEFAQNGKGDITVRQLLAHQAGLCVIDEPLTMEKLADPDIQAEILDRQRPLWEPGTKHGCHALSLGWYEGNSSAEWIRNTVDWGSSSGTKQPGAWELISISACLQACLIRESRGFKRPARLRRSSTSYSKRTN